MKKIFIFPFLILFLLLNVSSLFAQLESKGDTLIIGPIHPVTNQPLGALNYALKSDTADDGSRKHKVYKLQLGAQYLLTEVIQIDFPLVLVADKPGETVETRPPIIRCALTEDGSAQVDNWWHIFDNATFKNLWMSGVNIDGTGPISWITQTVNASNLTISYEGCIFEAPFTWWAMFADWAGHNTYKFTDCIFQYVGNPNVVGWNGAIFHETTADSVIIKNSTYYDFGAFAINWGGGTYYTEVDHCTFVNSSVHPVNNHRHIKQIFTNNLFVNCHAFSDDDKEISKHYDVEVKGLMNYAEIQWDPQELDSLWGPGGAYGYNYDPNGDGKLTDDELIWTLKNNNWYYTQDIRDYWDQFPQVHPNPWMNNYNKAMFNSKDSTGTWTWNLMEFTWADTSGGDTVIVENPDGAAKDTLIIVDTTIVTVEHQPYKYFTEENTTNLDPGIKNDNGSGALLAAGCIATRNGETVTNWHNVSDYLAFTWPLPYDLSYTNSQLENGGTDGKPVGSLQWWPEYTAIEKEQGIMPHKYALEQNYPNPFNPTTNISFSIPKKDKVTLTVYNVVGQKVKTLVNGVLTAGSYKYAFDGSGLASGVYIYQIQVGNEFQQSKKMILLK